MRMICFRNRLASNHSSQQKVGSSLSFANWFWIALAASFLISLAVPRVAQAQKKYTPEHKKVKAMADRAIAMLASGSKDHGQNTMAALAIVEHGKRYKKKVPKDNGTVKAAVEHIRDQCKKRTFLDEDETYYPAIALILLAEVDAERNHDQIIYLLEVLKQRQQPFGAYTYKGRDTGDCSQTQFAALAMWVAKSHGFDVNIDMAKNTLTGCAKRLKEGSGITCTTETGRRGLDRRYPCKLPELVLST